MRFWVLYLNIICKKCTIKAQSISRNTKFEQGIIIEEGVHLNSLSVGKYTYINKNCFIDKNTIKIGRFCSIAYNCRIGLGGHPMDWVSTHSFTYKPKYGFTKNNLTFKAENNQETIIGNDVWIGANSTILAGVKIGDGAIIGAHSLVTRDVEPYSIVFGTPAKHHKYRFEKDQIEKLLNLKWWNWDDDKIRENIELFSDIELFLKGR